jgi:hypothetical protein
MRFRFSNLPIALLAVVAVASMIKGARDGASRDRWTATNESLEARCEAWRAEHPSSTADPCRPHGPSKKLIPIYRQAQDDLIVARMRVRLDNDVAAIHLGQALDRAMEMDREATVLGSIMAAKVFEDVLDFMQKERAALGKERIAILLEGRSLKSARHPLAGERLAASSNIAAIPKSLPIPTGPFGRAVAAQAMNEHDETLTTMERAILARDKEGCMRAASERRHGFYPVLCDKMINVVRTSARLEHARANARRG